MSFVVEGEGVAVITLDPNCMGEDNQKPGSAGSPPLKADDDSLPAGSLQFGPPVLLGGQPWHSAAAKTDLRANESFVDTFFALSDTHLFGQYNYYGGPGSTPFVVSTDSAEVGITRRPSAPLKRKDGRVQTRASSATAAARRAPCGRGAGWGRTTGRVASTAALRSSTA